MTTIELVAIIMTAIAAGIIGFAALLAYLASLTPRQESYEDRGPVQRVPLLHDIPNPERYPKTWAYRAAKAEEETTDIMARGYQRPRNRRLNGEEL